MRKILSKMLTNIMYVFFKEIAWIVLHKYAKYEKSSFIARIKEHFSNQLHSAKNYSVLTNHVYLNNHGVD